MFKEAVLFSLLVVDGRPKKQVSVFSTRAQHKVAFSARLSALIATRLAEVAARTQPLFDAVDRELEAAGQSDQLLRSELGHYEFDVDDFAGSAEAAATRYLDGRDANDPFSFHRARYLSQQFVEELCSASGASEGLEREIERVIFEAHPYDQRDGAVTGTPP